MAEDTIDADVPQDVLTQPILNTPYEQPTKHWKLDERQRALNEIVLDRRDSGAYLPVPRDHPDMGLFAAEGDGAVQVQPHLMINVIRKHVATWRDSGWEGASRATRELLEYWRSDEVFPRPFFCQVEAVETIVWLREAGKRFDPRHHADISNILKEVNDKWNERIDRIAIKMATGTGKTMVMKMLIAWIAVNEERDVQFLVIAPGLTVKERLEELKPSASNTYDALLPPHLRERIHRAKVAVLNFQSFRKRDKLSVAGDQLSGKGKRLLTQGSSEEPESWKETDKEMLDRLLRSPRKGKVIVFNDEAHHCYSPAPPREYGTRKRGGGQDGEERKFEEAAALWFNALRSLRKTRRLATVYDFSATPMYLRVPAELQSELFPWTVSDYPLIEAIEAGLTKIPRVPTSDDTDNQQPVYRNVYENTNPQRLELNNMPTTVTSLLEQMHENYNAEAEIYARAKKSPVMIVVANSIENATTLYRHIAGYYDGKKWVPGNYPSFSNTLPDGSQPRTDPPTLLVHSGLDSSDDLPSNQQTILDQEDEIHTRGIDTKKERLEHIRKIFNTVGRPGEPGERIRCIVSVSMLTEGWDARTVSHIFGYRKFGTQLLCEQVAGRGLRRTSFDCEDENGLLPPETVNIFGIPFNFMRATPEPAPTPPREPYRVHSLPERAEERRITFPNVVSYRIELPRQEIVLDTNKVKPYEVEPKMVPSMTKVMGVTGESHITELTEKRRKYVLYRLAAEVLAEFEADESRRRELFRSAMASVQAWLDNPLVHCPDLRLLMVAPHIAAVPKEIARCCASKDAGEPAIIPVFADQFDPTQPRFLDTGDIDFETTKRQVRDTEKSELNCAPCDSWPEVRVAEALDKLDGITAWARNFRLGWKIPYFEPRTGTWKSYVPDFVARLQQDGKESEPVHLVIEYKGRVDDDSDRKAKAVRDWWLPSVNGSDDDCCAGEWRYVFIDSEEGIYPTLWEEIRR